MIAITALTKRLEFLESRQIGKDDVVLNAVMSSLSDDHISVLEEHCILLEHGFSEPDISVMMGNRYPEALNAAEIFQDRYRAIYTKIHPPRVPKQKKGRTYVRHDAALPKKV